MQNRILYIYFLWALVILSSILVSYEDESAERPEDWTEEIHASKATPNYDFVFSPGEVKRFDITFM